MDAAWYAPSLVRPTAEGALAHAFWGEMTACHSACLLWLGRACPDKDTSDKCISAAILAKRKIVAESYISQDTRPSHIHSFSYI